MVSIAHDRAQPLWRYFRAVIEGGSHGITWTHADQVNKELLAFLK